MAAVVAMAAVALGAVAAAVVPDVATLAAVQL